MKDLVYTHPSGNKLYRGKRPPGGLDFWDLHVETVINLEKGWFEFFQNKIGEENGWARECGVTIAHIPMSDFFEPTDDQIECFLEYVDFKLQFGDVFFHCLHGEDRTGFMAAVFKIKRMGWTPDQAIKEMLKKGFHDFPYGFWIEKLRRL